MFSSAHFLNSREGASFQGLASAHTAKTQPNIELNKHGKKTAGARFQGLASAVRIASSDPCRADCKHAEPASGVVKCSKWCRGLSPEWWCRSCVPGPMIAKVPSLSAGLSHGTLPQAASLMVGPPPRTKALPETLPVQDAPAAVPMAGWSRGGAGEAEVVSAISQQSLAITQLVAHLAGGDPLMDLAASSSSGGIGLSSKGVARRERMQADLANRTSSYFMQVQQQLFKRMNPLKPVPKTPEELAASSPSMTSYLERHGGYKQHREVGLCCHGRFPCHQRVSWSRVSSMGAVGA